MAPITIYGITISLNVQMVMFICKELGVEYEVVPVDITKGEHKIPSFLGKNPFGMIPVIEDDGFVLFESQAICKYLVERYGTGSKSGLAVAPASGILAWAKYEQALSIEAYSTHVQLRNLGYEKKFHPLFGVPVDETKCKALVAEIEGALAGYEAILSKQKYLAGEIVTLADLFHVPWGWVVSTEQGIAVFDKYPSVSRWWKDISSRPAWVATVKAASA